MVLSHLTLNPASSHVQHLLAIPYELHRIVMRAFPVPLAPGAERVLFRVDLHPPPAAPSLLVQSHTQPDWSWLETTPGRRYLLPLDEPNPAVMALTLSFVVGQVLAFRLLANPTCKTARAGRSQRVGLTRAQEQCAWLERKAAAGGFRLRDVHLNNLGVIDGGITGTGSQPTQFLAVRFDGVLEVTAPGSFAATIRSGIGSGKGFGFGLLSVAPPHIVDWMPFPSLAHPAAFPTSWG
jgi:CRISPR system Cascade subunit CasE